MMLKKDQLMIVIPAYNEEMNMEAVVKQWHPIIEKIGNESKLIIINDGSTDKTQEKLLGLKEAYPYLEVIEKKNEGHGATILYGYRYAVDQGAEYIFQTDSDGQTLPEEFWQLWEKRSACGLLIGSRKHRQDGWQRIMVTRVLRLVLGITFGCWVEDANTPYRLMRNEELNEALKKIPDKFFLSNVLMTVYYKKTGKHIAFYPITFRPRQGGKNSINMKRIVKIGWNAFGEFYKIGKKWRKYEK